MRVYFSHGKESGPWGTKIKRLAATAQEYGFEVESIDYSDLSDPDLRADRLLSILKEEKEEFILVGSSMGGYVSLVALEKISAKGVFLLAPALYMDGYRRDSYPATEYIEIVHGWSDDVIPVEHSIRYANEADCTLHLLSGDHRLNSSLEKVETLFRNFLKAFE